VFLGTEKAHSHFGFVWFVRGVVDIDVSHNDLSCLFLFVVTRGTRKRFRVSLPEKTVDINLVQVKNRRDNPLTFTLKSIQVFVVNISKFIGAVIDRLPIEHSIISECSVGYSEHIVIGLRH
jgi:hypothetical protein